MPKYTRVGNTKFELDTRADEDILDNWTKGLIDDVCESIADRTLSADSELKAIKTNDSKTQLRSGVKSVISTDGKIVKHGGYKQGSRYAGTVKIRSAIRDDKYLEGILKKNLRTTRI